MKPRHKSTATQVDPSVSAKAVGLRYVSDELPGITRLKSGKSFRYKDAKGKTVRDKATLQRIRSLVIPPAWTDVWICPLKDGHLQATGRDAKGRKQHRYHPLWREVRDATKYDRITEFGEVLPCIRRNVARDLRKNGLSRERVLATIVRLMDLTFIRVGNDEYAKQNQSYGLTTMKDQHAKIRGGRIQFSFKGKSGKHHTIEVVDGRLAKIVKSCQDIPGQELFQWIDEQGKRRDVTSGDVNDYLRAICATDFTAKDFRTWAGTVLALGALQKLAEFKTAGQGKKNLKQAVAIVAEKLGNTPTVCRKCYIHPFVLDGYINKKLSVARIGNGVVTGSTKQTASLRADERALLNFLRCCRRDEQRKTKRIAAKSAVIPPSWRPRVVRGMRVGHR